MLQTHRIELMTCSSIFIVLFSDTDELSDDETLLAPESAQELPPGKQIACKITMKSLCMQFLVN